MAQNKLFKWHLFDKDKYPLYVENDAVLKGDRNTLLKPDEQPTSLKYSPFGWKDVLVKFTRNSKSYGLFRDFTVPMKFVRDGARIIREYLFSVGFEAQLYISLSKWDQSLPYVYYKTWYLSELDLSKATWNRYSVTVQAVEGGPSKYLKANEGTNYEIDIESDPDRVNVYMDGLQFTNTVEWTVYKSGYFRGGAGTSEWDVGVGIIAQEGTSQGVIVGDQTGGELTIAPPGNRYFIKSVTKNITVNIEGKFKILYRGSGPFQLKIHRYKSDGSNTDFIIADEPTPSGQISVDYSQSIDLEPGDSLNMTLAVVSTSFTSIYISDSSFKLNYEVKFTPSIVPGIPVKTLAKRLIEKITDGLYGFESDFLDTLPGLIYTSGMGLRGQSNPKIKINWNDFFQSLRRWMVMYGINENQNIFIEKLDYAFRQQVAFDLGEVDNLEIVPAEPYIYNTIKTGYRNQTYDKVNGLDEFNVTQQWQTDIKRVSKELDLTSPVRADMYGIELTRIELYGKKTTDSSSDNDTFMLDCVKGGQIILYDGPFQVESGNRIILPGVLQFLTGQGFTITGGSLAGVYTVNNTSYLIDGFTTYFVDQTISAGQYTGQFSYYSDVLWTLSRPDYDSITGVLHPETAFNVELSPKRGLLNNSALIHSFCEDESGTIKFTAGDKNSELSTELAGVVITEKENLSVGSLADRLYLPYFLTFTAEVPSDFVVNMNADPYGEVAFTYRGVRFYGFVEDADVRPQQVDKAKFKLLASPKCDLTKLQKDI